MPEKPHKKILHIKVASILMMVILLPLLLAIFLIPNPFYSVPVGILIAILGVLMAILSVLIFYRIFKPLDTLLKGTQTLSGGNLNFRIDIRSGDEFEDVGSSFNIMAEKLQQAIIKLENEKGLMSAEASTLSTILSSIIDGIIAVDLSKRIALVNKAAETITGFTEAELKGQSIEQALHFFDDTEEVFSKAYCQPSFQKTLKLVGKNGKQAKVNILTTEVTEGIQTNLSCILILHDLSALAELEQMKLDFVSMASHELKTPLTNIIGYLSVFMDENRLKIPKEEAELLDRALVSSRVLLTLIENILSVNKIERDQLSVATLPLDYQDLLTKAVEDLQNQAKLKNITLTFATPQPPLPKVMADQVRILEVINNLIANAINYTNAGGEVTVSTQTNPTEVITTVSDTGIGIPKEAIPHLFNKFFRVTSQLRASTKGTGLGLFISKSIIQKLGGKIWVESEAGKGSKFHFSLPLAPKVGQNIDSQQFAKEAIQHGALSY